MVDLTYSKEFNYKHDNPYHDKLSEFEDFVYRDHEAEELKGKWNELAFKKEGELCLEIGSGYGQFMLEYCKNNPSENFVGLDYRFKRSFTLAKKLNKLNYRNFKYLRAKGERINFLFAENELDKVFYFFPDPWPKARHQKKRLFQENFLDNAYEVLKPGGRFYIKTDHDDYADWMEEVISKSDKFDLVMSTKDLHKDESEHFLAKYITKFEKIFLSQNINIKAFELVSLK